MIFDSRKSSTKLLKTENICVGDKLSLSYKISDKPEQTADEFNELLDIVMKLNELKYSQNMKSVRNSPQGKQDKIAKSAKVMIEQSIPITATSKHQLEKL